MICEGLCPDECSNNPIYANYKICQGCSGDIHLNCDSYANSNEDECKGKCSPVCDVWTNYVGTKVCRGCANKTGQQAEVCAANPNLGNVAICEGLCPDYCSNSAYADLLACKDCNVQLDCNLHANSNEDECEGECGPVCDVWTNYVGTKVCRGCADCEITNVYWADSQGNEIDSEEETRLIEDTMIMIGNIKGFKGVELAVIEQKSEDMGFTSKIKFGLAKALTGQQNALTIIGPATIVKEMKKDPKKLEVMMR